MAQVAQGAVVVLNGIDLSLVLKSVKTPASASVLDRTALGHSAKYYQKGLTEREVSGEGFFKSNIVTSEDANGLFNAALANRDGDQLFLFARTGAVGSPAEMMNLKSVKTDVSTVVGELLMSSFDAKVTKTEAADDFNVGVILFNATAQDDGTNGTGAAFDNGASAVGYYAQVHVTKTEAAQEAATYLIQHSTDGSTWVALDDENVEENSTRMRSDTSTTVQRYIRAVITPSDSSATVVIGIKLGYTG